ncbi:MAG: GNAT family N-acetyltransferase, partial [Salana multivorans]|nr:GNAT family N-acetyltransferase [Salana multivorans]
RLERASRPGDAELPELPGALRLADLPASEREAALRSWLRLNAVAFRDHPEQGRWTWEDVATRVAEPWFDPSLLLLVPDDAGSDLAASLWIKPQPPVGGRERAEVYVVAVHPDATGRGLGRSLLDHALGLLARRGVRYVELYVDGGNAPAVRLYDRAGFGVVERHAQYVRGASSTA